MASTPQSFDRVGRRCARACIRCREMKVRCSGATPCLRCAKKREDCVYKPEEQRVTVTQSYLKSLEMQVESHRAATPNAPRPARSSILSPPQTISTQPGDATTIIATPVAAWNIDNDTIYNDEATSQLPDTSRGPTSSSTPVITDPDFAQNPLADNGETFALDPMGKYWYMGPASSWSFCRRVMGILSSRMPQPEPPVHPWDLETLNLTWTPIGLRDQPDTTNLPSYEYAVFLTNAVKYHLGSWLEIINYESFHNNMRRFYEEPETVSHQSRFWYAQYLFVLAFGEAFTSTSTTSSTVPGIDYASRALALIPSIIPVTIESLAATEALCLGAIYLQAVDLRLMAFQLIGQALKLAIIEGWHRHMPEEYIDKAHAKRCNTVFWLVYIIDQEFGSLVGGPTSIRDEDITAKLPNELENSSRASALTIQIRLARLTATILAGVYGVERSARRALIRDTQAVLHSLASVSRDLIKYVDSYVKGVDVRSSKVATRLILSYHHCVVLTTRPLVMCALQRRLAKGDAAGATHGPINSLLQSCAHSALSILRTLESFCDTNHLDSFLPFQMETTFSSAFLLYILNAILPDSVPPNMPWHAKAHAIFDTMIARGSPSASLRKRDFQRLEMTMDSYIREEHSAFASSANSATRRGRSSIIDEDMIPLSWELLTDESGFTMTANEIIHLADGLDLQEFSADT